MSGGVCDFTVWAPLKREMGLKLISSGDVHPMEKDDKGYWRISLDEVSPGDKYVYVSEDMPGRPDPASFFQPDGVNKPSGVFDHNAFKWEDKKWDAIPLSDMIMYELHIGTFSEEGTFSGASRKLDHIKNIGVNAVEIMPVSQFPGARNWGYDGVHPYAVQNTYGGPSGLKAFVNECHKRGIAVILDVVYNHLGPEGNHLFEFGPYFTDKYSTPWGWAINYDDKYSCGVREYFISNALYWFEYFHIDALRLDAIHGICDFSAKHILEEMKERVAEYCISAGRAHYLIAESDLNDSRVIRDKSQGGYDLDCQWLDDLHHSLRTLITDDRRGYYMDFGQIRHLVKALKEGFVYSWDYSVHRKKLFGSYSGDLAPSKFIVFQQNHDQVGNRLAGDRLTTLTDSESVKLAAGLVLLSPYIPMLFMGEEYGETAPFLYFIDHMDKDLVEAVRKGRKEEFSSFEWAGDPPDPKAEETFNASKLDWEKAAGPKGMNIMGFYRALISIRKSFPTGAVTKREEYSISHDERGGLIIVNRSSKVRKIIAVFNLGLENPVWGPSESEGPLRRILDSSDSEWSGSGEGKPDILNVSETVAINAHSLVVYEKEIKDE